MLETFLIPAQTIEAKGEATAIALGEAAGQRFLVSLEISRVIEQESLSVSIWGSEDGTGRGAAALRHSLKSLAPVRIRGRG